MRAMVIYKDLSTEQINELLLDDNVESVKTEPNDEVISWLKKNNLEGMAISYAHDKYMRDCNVSIGKIEFSKIVLKTGKYYTKNIRIGDSVQRCFIRKDGARYDDFL